MELPVGCGGPSLPQLTYLQPLTVVEPLTFSVHAGRPVKRIVAGPHASTRAVSVAFASTVDEPSAVMCASRLASFAASSAERPRTSAVSLRACPPSLAL